MAEVLLRLENIQKRIAGNTILDNISLKLDRGESLLIRGKSGCGKTTLLRCIALLEQIDRGQILFDGKVVSEKGVLDRTKHKPEIGMVFQQLYLWPHLTVLDNVSLPLHLRQGGHKKLADGLAIEKLSQLGVIGKETAYPHQLSGGQRQRVALARALVHSPSLLLLDEITANLDPETASVVLELVEKIIISGTTVIMISHLPVTSPAWMYELNASNWELERRQQCNG
jgi:polar amino acid transport system ATP-binding protein